MGKIIATCGHEISLDWFESDKGKICVEDTDRELNDCVSYLLVCPKCLEWYEKEGLIIKENKSTRRPQPILKKMIKLKEV